MLVPDGCEGAPPKHGISFSRLREVDEHHYTPAILVHRVMRRSAQCTYQNIDITRFLLHARRVGASRCISLSLVY